MTKLSYFVIQISFWRKKRKLSNAEIFNSVFTSNVQISYKKMVYPDLILYNRVYKDQKIATSQ